MAGAGAAAGTAAVLSTAAGVGSGLVMFATRVAAFYKRHDSPSHMLNQLDSEGHFQGNILSHILLSIELNGLDNS